MPPAAERLARAALLSVALAAPPALAQGLLPAQAPGIRVPVPAPAAPVPPKEKGPTFIDAERIDGVSDLEVSARGKAELKQDETLIFGDELRYNREFERFEAEGGARIEQGTDRFFGPRLRYRATDGTGDFVAPSYLMDRDPPVRGTADYMEFLGPGRYRMQKGTFTTCRPGQEDWRLDYDELVLDYEAKEGEARGARMTFLGQSGFKVPYLPFSLDNQRKSGFITPMATRSSRRGYEVGVPYYWNIAPEMDATITPLHSTKRGEQLKTNFRYMGANYAGDLNLELLPDDRELKTRRTGFGFQHRQRITPQLSTNIDLNKVSDHRYFVDLASRVSQTSIGNLQRLVQLNYGVGVPGLGLGIGTGFTLQRFQTLQDPLAPVGVPYHRVPQINVSTGKNDIGGLFDAALPAEYVRFTHPTLVRGERISLNPTVAMPILAPGYFITPKAGLRYIGYNLENTAPGQNDRQSASIPWMSVDAGLIFDRPLKLLGQSLTQTLEPRFFYVRAPYKDQSRIPLFDTGLSDLNYAQLFTENRFAGGDRFGDANQLTAALTSRLVGENGQELLRGTIGQRYYFADEKVAANATTPLRTVRSSDIIASVGGRPAPAWSVDATMQYNMQDERAQRYRASVRYAPEIAKVVTAGYGFNRDVLRQADVSGQWPVAAGLYAIGRANYSFRDSLLLDGLAGLEYHAGCWIFRSFARRVQAAAQIASTEIFFQLEFLGLGQLGSDDTPIELRRHVPGYAPTNPPDRTLVPQSLRPRLPFQQVF